MGNLSKQAAYDWLRSRFRPLGMDSGARERACQAALEHWSPDGSQEGWKSWVASCLKGARKDGVQDPVGCLIANLKADPGDALQEPEPKKLKHIPGQPRSGEQPDPLGDPVPQLPWGSVVALVRQRSMTYREASELVHTEWAKQGRPWPQEFDPTPLEVTT